MLNEWNEFQDYTGVVSYTARNKQDTTYLGRFTFDTILDFEGLNRVLTILARGFLFHNENGSPVKAPWERIDYAKRGLCAWCSVPDSKKATPREAWQFGSDFGKKPRPGRRGSLAVTLENSMGSFPALWRKTAADGFTGMYIEWRISCGKIPSWYPAALRRSAPPLRKALTGPGGTS